MEEAKYVANFMCCNAELLAAFSQENQLFPLLKNFADLTKKQREMERTRFQLMGLFPIFILPVTSAAREEFDPWTALAILGKRKARVFRPKLGCQSDKFSRVFICPN
jgi:hypothetical protein